MAEEKSKKGHLAKEEEEHEPEHSAHVKKLHHGYHITKMHRDGAKTEHAAEDVDGAMDHVMDHMQAGEQDPGQDQMAQGGTVPGGEPQAGGMM